MTTQPKLGRPVTKKTARVRSSIKSALKKHGRTQAGDRAVMSTNDIAKIAKQSKERTIFALRYFEKNEFIKCVGRSEPIGRGQPPKLWEVNDSLYDQK